jgi:hypothetical protein
MRTLHILELSESEHKKTVYVAICRQNEKGENGRCSEIESAIVPQMLCEHLWERRKDKACVFRFV